MKEEIAKEIFDKEDRFKMLDQQVFKKVKTINKIITSSLYSKLFTTFPCLNKQLKEIVIQNIENFQLNPLDKQKVNDYM